MSTRPEVRRRPWFVALPLALVVLGIVTIGPNQALGSAFIVASLAAATAAAAVVVRGRQTERRNVASRRGPGGDS